MKNIIFTILTIFTLILVNLPMINAQDQSRLETDLDPLTDVKVTFTLDAIRSLEKHDNHLNFKEYIDRVTNPDFYVIITINDQVRKSQIWFNKAYVYDPDFSFEVDVPDDEEFVNITIELWDWNFGLNQRCDISGDAEYLSDSYDVELTYSIKYGNWWGDDHTEANDYSIPTDPSGYGRLNGCDDGSIYQRERDCELWFTITQTDPDGDGIPYWAEVNEFGTDPEIDDRGRDDDVAGSYAAATTTTGP